ncbi:MAG: ABC-2 transporter permease, partial [Gammaproteobacteria bacterium]|nr:ABC-2 transporter permease [Gammaproteobacteria bacterium]
MMLHQLALIRREVWEHRSLWMTPAAVAVVVSLLVLTSFVAASGFSEMVDIAIIGASNVGDNERRAALLAFLVSLSLIFVISMWVLTVFYSLDSLYAERKDKSILFWRSLPITDAETVISKLLTTLTVIPLLSFVAVVATHIVSLLLTAIWVSKEGGDAGHLIWGSVPLFDTWAAMLVLLLATPLWLSPFIGWFLFVSAWTKRSPLLMAFMPIIIVPIFEYVIFRTSILWNAIGDRLSGMPLFHGFDASRFFDKHELKVTDDSVSLLGQLDIARFLGSPGFWLGLIVCGLLTTA